jgi:sporulation protein YlmC with PRC-barrel domain
MEIAYGAEVVDSKGQDVGKVDYVMRDAYTGEITKFKVSTELTERDLFYSTEDVAEVTAASVKLKVPFQKG